MTEGDAEKAIDWDFIKRIRERLKEPCRCRYDGCHCWSETDVEFLSDYFSVLESSLASARAEEREKDAKIAEDELDSHIEGIWNKACREIAEKIRKGG